MIDTLHPHAQSTIIPSTLRARVRAETLGIEVNLWYLKQDKVVEFRLHDSLPFTSNLFTSGSNGAGLLVLL